MRAGAGEPDPLTVVLRDATPELPVGRSRRTNAAGLPVLEVALDHGGPPELPPHPYKLVRGVDPVDLA
jgi:hypothetical protein